MSKIITVVAVVIFVIAMLVMAFAGRKAKNVEPKNKDK